MKTKKSAQTSVPKRSRNDDLYSDERAPQGDAWKKGEFLLFEPKTLIVIIITSVVTMLFAFFGDQGVNFLTSVISTVPPHAAFDGTVAPIKQVPNYVKLTEAERKYSYDQLPASKFMAFPTYDAAHLALSTDGLKWNDPNDDRIRNEKITFSTPYLGTYRLDGIEGVGSHAAVDIKIPVGTPIQSIANGTVVKADTGNGGFGHHIVIQHNNFPSIEDPNKKVTYYSSYSHLSVVQVKVNDVVVKGQQIGLSGMTGTATTPHLHFQIDTDSVAWHPYWPFSSAEQREAGYGFFEAINNGLGLDKAKVGTIHPMMYVQKYYQGQQVAGLEVVNDSTTTPTPVVDPAASFSFSVVLPGGVSYPNGASVPFALQGFDATGKMLSLPAFSDTITLATQNNLGSLSRTTFTSQDFKTGMVSGLTYTPLSVGKDTLILTYRGKQFKSQEFEVKAKTASTIDHLLVTSNSQTGPMNQPFTVNVQAFDANGNLMTGEVDFGTSQVKISVNPPIGTVNKNELAPSDFVNGMAQVTMTATQVASGNITFIYNNAAYNSPTLTVFEADPSLAATVTTTTDSTGTTTPETVTTPTETPAVDTTTTTPPVDTGNVVPAVPQTTQAFTDVGPDSKYFVALNELKAQGLISGYSDGSYKPDATVTRAEAITFILRVLSQEVKDEIKAIFPDVPGDQWFSKYVTTAFEMGFVKGYPDGTFKPTVTVNLAEFATMLFVAARADIDPIISSELPTGVNATDWFAPYIQAGLKKGILVAPNNTVNASKALTRGDVGEILYRLRNIVNELKR